ncbi:phytanoyl-CoA dioxygenase family protein [Schlegelella sp. S2-27]|uniref:Phytanoyl-CoA dioxygenase family protein n=1 Tax=Caldimonas mangrovi TaxID=2944811 RepID=A0ABT0YXS0_9BURK|nr:phytanoyl-CoA dioxygenase family protein [Caldimonas mangrovi]MCM5682638.1 phytanoyl-CoA dioxygenase family protein [Caldimonas mangrovi]
MTLALKNFALAPIHALALLTGAKSFRDNPLIGSRRLNEWGLHAGRVQLAHALAASRRARLAAGISAADRAAFDRDGFVIRRDVLPAAAFEQLRERVLGHRAPAREMVQGDTITRRIALDPAFLRAIPEVREIVDGMLWRGLTRYVGSYDQEPVTYVQSILSQVIDAPPDPQTHLHADTFHPTVKAWYFLTDVEEDAGPFSYVPGSHRLTPQRLAWERQMSLVARTADRLTSRGSFRVGVEALPALGLPPPRLFTVPANTLVVADTFGFHARGPSLRPALRIELWGYGRRNPFLPWAGADLLSLPGIAARRAPLYWSALDLRERRLGKRSPWRDAGLLTPGAPAAPIR